MPPCLVGEEGSVVHQVYAISYDALQSLTQQRLASLLDSCLPSLFPMYVASVRPCRYMFLLYHRKVKVIKIGRHLTNH